MGTVLVLHPDPRTRALLVDSLEPTYQLETAEDWMDLERILQSMTPLGCILDIFHLDRASALPTLRKLRREHPSPALIACSDFTGREMELYHLGRLNVDGVIRLEEELPARQILGVVDRAMVSALASMVLRSVVGGYPPMVQDAVRWAIEHSELRPQVSDLAAALALSHRSLARVLKVAEVAPPSTLLLWGRLIQASYLLARPRETVESVAYRLAYSTPGALRKALKRHVGCSPTSLLQRGGLAWTLEVFKRRGLAREKPRRSRWASSRRSKWRLSPHARTPR
ncbi:helix-turn-helix domain-containing protein [Gemmatimonadota bacterium]